MDDFTDLVTPQPAAWGDRPQWVILQCVTGSRAYGTADPDSDHDRRGVFLAPSLDFFGLDDPPRSADNPYADEVLYELGRFSQLALKGSPAILEILWLGDYEICTPEGDELVRLRWAFLDAERVRAAYLGAARSMLAGVRRGARTEKSARHLLRLLQTGLRFWQTGFLQTRVEDPDQIRAFGRRVAAGDVQAAVDLLDDYERQFAGATTVLPPTADRVRIDDWLKDVRRRQLGVRVA